MWLPIAGLAVGFLLVDRSHVAIPGGWGPYLGVAILAGLDGLISGVRAALDQRYQGASFLGGFLLSILFAPLLVYVGKLLELDLLLGVVVVLGIRLFGNLLGAQSGLTARWVRNPSPDLQVPLE